MAYTPIVIINSHRTAGVTRPDNGRFWFAHSFKSSYLGNRIMPMRRWFQTSSQPEYGLCTGKYKTKYEEGKFRLPLPTWDALLRWARFTCSTSRNRRRRVDVFPVCRALGSKTTVRCSANRPMRSSSPLVINMLQIIWYNHVISITNYVNLINRTIQGWWFMPIFCTPPGWMVSTTYRPVGLASRFHRATLRI